MNPLVFKRVAVVILEQFNTKKGTCCTYDLSVGRIAVKRDFCVTTLRNDLIIVAPNFLIW